MPSNIKILFADNNYIILDPTGNTYLGKHAHEVMYIFNSKGLTYEQEKQALIEIAAEDPTRAKIELYGYVLTQAEAQILFILKEGKGVSLKSKADLKNYPNLCNGQMIYINNWGGLSIRPTDHFLAIYHNRVQQ